MLNPVSDTDVTESMFGPVYQITYDGGVFRFTIDSYRYINNDDLVEFRIRRLPVSTVPLDLTQIFSVIQSADEQTIEVDRAAEYPPTWLADSPTHASRYHLDDPDIYFSRVLRYPTLTGHDAADDHFRVPVGYGRVLPLSSLPTFNLKKRLGGLYGIGAIHMSDDYTADETIILPNPSLFIPTFATEWVLTLHNQNKTYKYHIEDSDEELIATLLPHEILSLRFSRNSIGDGEITNANKFDRVMRYSYTPPIADIVVTTQDYMAYDSDLNIRLIPLGETPQKIHEEAFTIGGSATFTEGDDFNDVSDYSFPEAVTIEEDGRLRLDVEIGARTQGGSGNISTGHGLVVLHQHEQLDPVELAFPRQSSMGAFENETWFTYLELDVEAGDIILFGFAYSNTAAYNMDSMRFSNIRVEMTLEQTIRVTE